jgi:hypothetical protein
MPFTAILTFIKSPLAKVLGILAMLAAAFAAGMIFQGALSSADRNKEKAEDAQAVATHSVQVATLAQNSNRINTGVSNYVQNRTADLSSRLGGGLRASNDYRPLPRLAGSATGAAACAPGCVSVERYNDLQWEAGNTAVMVEGWQLWYERQHAAWQEFLQSVYRTGDE